MVTPFGHGHESSQDMTKLPGFIILGQEDWDEVWRRNQFLIAGLARRCPATKFLFVELPFDLTYGLRSRQIFRPRSPVQRKLACMRRGIRRVAGLPNIYTLVAPKLLPDALPVGERLNAALAAGVIRRALVRIGVERPILWTQNPFAAPMLGHLGEQWVIYDVTDDWTVLEGTSPRFIARAQVGDALLTRRADCVIACSPYLYTRKQIRNPRTVLIPNGVDVEHYRGVGAPDTPVAPRIAALPHPILGYTGSLHEARLDLDLVCALAAARPDVSLVFVGPIFLPQRAQERLRRFANIHLLGPVPYREIPAYMQGCNALMIPHRVSEFTESLNPIKVFEYLAAGLPVVATAVAGVREYTSIIKIAHSYAEFIRSVEDTIRGKAFCDRDEARRLAQAASWESRIDAVLDAFAGVGVGRCDPAQPGTTTSPVKFDAAR
jgi:glycosyltransferase involved in cell wall biosynthesis